jgi:hypothetical protein
MGRHDVKRSPLVRRVPLSRGPLERSPQPKKRRKPVSPASPEQRAKVKVEASCVVCGSDHVHPAHLIDRSLGGDDDPRAVVALCPAHHREYDDDFLSLVEYLEPYYREEVAYAVMTVGIVRALERLTNQRWAPIERAA